MSSGFSRRTPSLIVGLLALLLVSSACSGANGQSGETVGNTGGDGSESGGTSAPTVLGSTTVAAEPAETSSTATPPSLAGTLTLAGSVTVDELTQAVLPGFAVRQPGVEVRTSAAGTTSGFQALCNDPDVSVVGASRSINGQESASCLASGIRPIELRIARDGIAVIANKASSLQCVTYADLYALAGPESTGLTTGPLVTELAAELGSSTDFGSGAVSLIAPGANDATTQLFLDLVIKAIAKERGVPTFMRVDNRSLDSNSQLVDAVAADPSAVGILGSSAASRSADLVNLIGVSDGSGCVIPNDAAVAQGLYPLARDLYLYVDGNADDPIVDDFIYYYLNVALRGIAQESQYVPLSPDEEAETIARWDRR